MNAQASTTLSSIIFGDVVERALEAYFAERALKAYCRWAQIYCDGRVDPACRVEVSEVNGKEYVRLKNYRDDIVAVYRVLNSGKLKRLVRWPAALEVAQ